MDADELSKWLFTRLTGDQGRADWRRLLEAATERALDAPLQDFIERDHLFALIDAHRSEAIWAMNVRTLIRPLIQDWAAHARNDTQPVGRWVDAKTRSALMTLLERPGLVNEAWVRAVFAQKASEELLTDTLYRALLDFSTLVPRIVQSLLPSGLSRLAKLGGKATGNMGGRLIEELERRLEPEVRKFLDKGTRKALEGAANFTVERLDTPGSIEARKNMVAFMLDQSPAFHVAPLTDELLGEIETIVEAWARTLATHEAWAAALNDALKGIYESAGAEPIRTWLRLTESPPYDAWADATWPSVIRILEGEVTRDWLDGLAREIWAVTRASDEISDEERS